MSDLALRDEAAPTILTEGAALDLINQAEHALAQAESPEQAEDIWRKVATLEEAARRARLSSVVAVAMSRTKLRAERRWGELLPPPEKTGRPKADESVSETQTLSEGEQEAERKARNAEAQARRTARKLADVPQEIFDEYVESGRAENAAAREVIRDDVFTRAGVFNAQNVYWRELRRDERRERSAGLAAVSEPGVVRSYPVLCADPPWRYDANATPDLRSIENHYPTMTLDELKAFDTSAADDSVMFMWATSPKLVEALDLLDVWGFHYRTCMVWVKDKIGMGYYARQQHELLLIGKRGDIPTPEPSDRPSSVITAPRGRHSEKPSEAYEAIERMYPDFPRVELFARGARPGWDVRGNEAQEVA